MHMFKRPALQITLFVLLVLLSLYQSATHLRFDSNWRSWYTPETLAKYDAFVEAFGYDDVVMVAVENNASLEKNATLSRLEALSDALARLDIVSRVDSPVTMPLLRFDNESLRFDPLGRIAPAERKDLLKKNGLLHYLADERLRHAMIIVHIDDRFAKAKEDPSAAILAKIRAVLARFDMKYRLFGGTVVTEAFAASALSDLLTVVPTLLLVLSLLLFWLFRSVSVVAVYWAIVAGSLAILLALLTLLDEPINNFTADLPLYITVISLSDMVHLLIGLWRHRALQDARERWRRVLQANFWPIVLTSVTTGVGFLSLATAEIAPVRHFGIAVALATVIVFGVTLFLLRLWVFGSSAKIVLQPVIVRIVGSVRRLVVHRFRRIVILFAALFAFGALGTARLTIDSNLLHYFRDDTPLVKDIRWIQKHLTGVVNDEIILDTHQKGGALDPKFLESVRKYTEYLRATYPQIRKVLSPVALLMRLDEAMTGKHVLPKSKAAVAQLLLLYEMSQPENDLSKMFDADRQKLHLSLLLDEVGTQENLKLFQSASFWQDTPYSIAFNGSYPLFAQMQSSVTKTLLFSLGSTFVVLTILLLAVLRSFMLALGVLGLNLMPVVMTLGLLGWLGVPLDLGLAVSFAVILAIAIDDTLHFLFKYRMHRRENDPIDATLQDAGAGMLGSSIVLIGAFALLLLSRFMPNVHFGLSSVIAIAAALLVDILFVPSLLQWLRSRDIRRR